MGARIAVARVERPPLRELIRESDLALRVVVVERVRLRLRIGGTVVAHPEPARQPFGEAVDEHDARVVAAAQRAGAAWGQRLRQAYRDLCLLRECIGKLPAEETAGRATGRVPKGTLRVRRIAPEAACRSRDRELRRILVDD